MKVIVDGKVWDPEDVIVIVDLTPADKLNISNMDPECSLYCAYPDKHDPRFVEGILDSWKRRLKGETDE